jgi:fluoride ion exporter CrcB/FEX
MQNPLKAGRAALLSVVLLIALAGPAGAGVRGTPGMTVPVVLAKAKPWHFWLAPVLGLSFVGLLLMMLLGYMVKVVMLKYGVKVGRKTT